MSEQQINKTIEKIVSKGIRSQHHLYGILLNGGMVHVSNEKDHLLIIAVATHCKARQGVGRDIMADVLAAADEFGVTCKLFICPWGKKYMDKEKLKQWCIRLGFTIEKDVDIRMIRSPKINAK